MPCWLSPSVLAMSQDELSGPDLAGVVADANAVGLPYVVIGGFSVIANGYLRATDDSDLLVPDGAETDAAIQRFLDLGEATRLYDGKELGQRTSAVRTTCASIVGTASSTSCGAVCLVAGERGCALRGCCEYRAVRLDRAFCHSGGGEGGRTGRAVDARVG